MGDAEDSMAPSTGTVLALFFCLLALIFLLIFLYMKLNREAEGEYTIRRMVYKEGGVRDRVRGAAVALGRRLGVRLWPGSASEEDGEEMRDVRDLECGSSCGSDMDGNQDEEEEEEEDHRDARGDGKASDSSDDNSNSSEEEEDEEEEEKQDKGMDLPKGEEEEGKTEGKQDTTGPEQVKVEASGGAGLLIDLKQFSGSAIWSEEGGCVDVSDDVTAL